MNPQNINRILREKLVDATYYRRYYHSSTLSDILNCPICNRVVTSQKLKRHQQTKICKPINNNISYISIYETK